MRRRDLLLDRAYARLARSDAALATARHVRGIASAVIAKRLAPSTLPEYNGELWLAGRVASDVTVAIDVGANVGDWSAMALSRFGRLERLLAYEPGLIGDELRRRLDGDPRATVITAAVSDQPGTIPFYDETTDSKLSSVVKPTGLVAREVPCVRLDDEFDAREIEHVDFLKVDVEGLDLHVLRGAERALREQRVSIVQYEYSPMWQDAGSTLRAAHRLLTGAGYRVLLITQGALREFDPAAQTELYTYANFVALLPAAAERLAPVIRPGW